MAVGMRTGMGEFRRASIAIPALLLAAACRPAFGQVFDFAEVPVPEARSLSTHYMFYVYTEKDAPKHGGATVHFRQLMVKPGSRATGGTDEALSHYKSLQVSILTFKDFWELVDPSKFCATADDTIQFPTAVEGQLLLAQPAHNSTAVTQLVGATAPLEEKVAPLTTGVYVLVFSNCGDLEGMSISGSVAVQNAWGYLPAIEYYKKPMYGCLAVFYGVASVGWALLALRWWKQLYYIQKGITALLVLGLAEAVLWWALYTDWNTSGVHSSTLFLAAGLASVGKLVLAFRLVLLTALDKEGMGAVEVEGGTSLKVHLALMMYMVLEFNLRTVMSYRHSRALKLTFVAANAAPAVLMGMLLFIWAHIALYSLVEVLMEKKDDKRASIFSRTQAVLGFASFSAALAVALQLLDPTVQDDFSMWKYHTLVTDGSAQILFGLVLLASMVIWLPSEGVQGYEYAAQSQDGTIIGAPSGVIWDDEALDEEAKPDGSEKEEHNGGSSSRPAE